VNPSTTRTIFRTVAIAEAISWAGLLIAMFFKWIVQDDPHTGIQGGVPIMGPIHGVIFLAYVVSCFLARRSFGWSTRTTLLALAASIPPIFTYVFEVAADRRGLLGQRAGATSAP
jgi:integral membrane protein